MYAFTEETKGYTDEFLRIHVRADSNEEEAQAVKYLVRDHVVEYLTPLVATYQTKAEAMQGVESHLSELAKVATSILRENGFKYVAKAVLKREYFPTRVYGNTTLPSGEYTALILTLGRGEGDNWWCVVYPPLCLSSSLADKGGYTEDEQALLTGNTGGYKLKFAFLELGQRLLRLFEG